MGGMKTLQATVVRHTGSHYFLSELPQWNPFPAVMRGKVRLGKSASTNPVAVGDRVECLVGETVSEESPALITKILPRSNYLIRKSTNLSREAHVLASNVDMAFVIVTLAFPEVKLPFLDRILVTCGVYGIPVTIVLNKVDLLREAGASDLIEAFRDIYSRSALYRIIETSAITGEGIAQLRQALSAGGATAPTGHLNPDCCAIGPSQASLGPSPFVWPGVARGCGCPVAATGAACGINLLTGVSGVGKSSLIKALDPTLNPRIAEISLAHLQGRHTTTFYEMYPLSGGGYIIDTPGIRSFGLLDVENEEISKYFPEMLRVADNCRFAPCTHTHEPHCAVKEAVDNGEITPERYNSYLGMLEESKKYR